MTREALRIRQAYPREISTLVEFNRALAKETEGVELDPERVRAGVEAVFAEPSRGTYWMALRGEEPLGGLLVTSEWSDWRNGNFWWIQSVYVVPGFRRRGVYRRLYRHLQAEAAKKRAVCGFRLYVERDNRRAQATYRANGMERTQYLVYEQLKPGVRFFKPAPERG